jgi:hypothetical protein
MRGQVSKNERSEAVKTYSGCERARESTTTDNPEKVADWQVSMKSRAKT